MIKQIKYNPKVIQKRPMVTPTNVQASEIRVKEGMVEGMDCALFNSDYFSYLCLRCK